MATSNSNNVKVITYAINSLIEKLSYYGGSAEVEWSYQDFRNDMRTLMNRHSNIKFSEEEEKEIGESICNAINEHIKDVHKFMNE